MVSTTEATQEAVNYAQEVLDELAERLPDCDTGLLELYALLALARGGGTTLENVHDAWSIWRNRTRPDHPSLIPFIMLVPDVRELDRKYADAIREAAAELVLGGAPDPEPPLPGSAPPPPAAGVDLISAERQRQITAEGWTPEHDAHHAEGELARAASCYATPPERRLIGTRLADGHGDRGDRYAQYPQGWPWHPDWWKPGDRIRELAKAGALIAAELDRLLAAAEATP